MFQQFLALLMDKVNIQRKIATQNNSITKFNETYRNLFQFFSF